jgi:hypothetical protein
MQNGWISKKSSLRPYIITKIRVLLGLDFIKLKFDWIS